MGQIIAIKDYNIDVLKSQWSYCIGAPSKFLLDRIGFYLAHGLDSDDISYAIDETASAPEPSLRYFLAICNRMKHEREEDE